jgi:hypothetical protein
MVAASDLIELMGEEIPPYLQERIAPGVQALQAEMRRVRGEIEEVGCIVVQRDDSAPRGASP